MSSPMISRISNALKNKPQAALDMQKMYKKHLDAFYRDVGAYQAGISVFMHARVAFTHQSFDTQASIPAENTRQEIDKTAAAKTETAKVAQVPPSELTTQTTSTPPPTNPEKEARELHGMLDTAEANVIQGIPMVPFAAVAEGAGSEVRKARFREVPGLVFDVKSKVPMASDKTK
eukprot:1350472-Amorphochlora_amoeboformis.AAC.1